MIKIFNNYFIYNFPKYQTGCYNDIDCGSDGKCNVVLSSGNIWYKSPKLYNPLDNCKSYYYDYTSQTIHIINLCVSVFLNVILLIIIRKHIKSEFLI